MKTVFFLLLVTVALSVSVQAQESLKKQHRTDEIQDFQPLLLRGFDSTGLLTKELTGRELDLFFQIIYRDSSVTQLKNDFENPNKELAPIVGKLSEETKRLLLKTARFSPGPKHCSKD